MRVIVIGGGPAGLMAAGTAALEADVTLLERNDKVGKKLYITGKGRCNITNNLSPTEFMSGIVSNGKFMLSAINRFSPQDTIEFLSGLGVDIKIERGGRVFPLSDKASDVTKALTKYCTDNNVKFKTDVFVKKVCSDGDMFNVIVEGGEFKCDKVILACGGMSYPSTGSDGGGYRLAANFGHSLVKPVPALVGIDLKQSVKMLEGLSLKNVTATIAVGKQKYSQFGEMLFTARGVSGPIILSLSSYINRADLDSLKLVIDLKPALNNAILDKRILSDFSKYANKQLANALFDLLPRSLIPYIIEYAEIPPDKPVNVITKEERNRLVAALKNLTFDIAALGSIQTGIVTAGGINVNEVNPKSMESKLVKGLYIVGEMLDVDALTGGYNIQIALSTGYLAGLGVVKDD